MTKTRLRVCLVGATHPCHNPRLVREADTLVRAGHEVRVVAPQFTPSLIEKDRRLLQTRAWRFDAVTVCGRSALPFWPDVGRRVKRRIASRSFALTGNLAAAVTAYVPAFEEQVACASSERADWFIAHAHPALPVAAAAAGRWGARLGFDCEDLLAEAGSDPAEMVRLIERTYLPCADYVSVPSQGIARRLSATYAIASPTVLYNVFPLSLARRLTPPPQRVRANVVRLHWFGQTIGPGRGLEDAVQAMGLLGPRVELHLRGHASEGYWSQLCALADRYGAQDRLYYYPQVDHDDLITSLGAFDVGLALERSGHGNYDLTVTNKVFSYLLAGLALAATDTTGQREVLERVPSAGFLYPAGDVNALAGQLQAWVGNRDSLIRAQHAAWSAARQRFNWDVEMGRFMRLLEAPSDMVYAAECGGIG